MDAPCSSKQVDDNSNLTQDEIAHLQLICEFIDSQDFEINDDEYLEHDEMDLKISANASALAHKFKVKHSEKGS